MKKGWNGTAYAIGCKSQRGVIVVTAGSFPPRHT
jgi:hypothetical protein